KAASRFRNTSRARREDDRGRPGTTRKPARRGALPAFTEQGGMLRGRLRRSVFLRRPVGNDGCGRSGDGDKEWDKWVGLQFSERSVGIRLLHFRSNVRLLAI